jgi:hypothetical protein
LRKRLLNQDFQSKRPHRQHVFVAQHRTFVAAGATSDLVSARCGPLARRPVGQAEIAARAAQMRPPCWPLPVSR